MNIGKLSIASLIMFALVTPVSWSEQPEKIEKTVGESIETRKSTQEKSKQWFEEKDKTKNRYYQLKEELDHSRVVYKRMKELVERQEAYLSRTEAKLVELERLKEGLVPYLEEVIALMEAQIAGDLPFLLGERKPRVENLKALLYDPAATLGEKFRRVFEGLRVEIEYGKSVEVTKEEVVFGGNKLLVKILRVGRTALLLETLDGKETGIFNRKLQKWDPLPKAYKSEIVKAMDIAERKRPVEFVNLPLKVVSK